MAELTATMNEPSQNPYNTRWGTSGTLGSQGLYQGVAPPRQSQAQGIQGTDNRAYTRQVTGNELVQNQMMGLSNRGGAWLQNAAQRGRQDANRRGLVNSSIASGSAERSALEAAMPIAQADAATYGRTQAENMEALNRGLMQERDIMNQQTLEGQRQAGQGISAGINAQLTREGFQQELQRQRENLAFQGEMQGLDRSQQQWMAQFGLGANMTLGQQGYGFDLGRMQAQDYYNSQQGQRDTLNQLTMAEYGMGLQAMGNFYNRFGDEFFDNPHVYADPYVQQAVMNFGTTFRPQFMSLFNSIYGRG